MASGPVIIDPKALREFSSRLNAFNTELGERRQQLDGQFKQLGTTWRDPAYASFAKEFEQTMRHLEHFQTVVDEILPKLQRTADRAEDVHR